MPDDVVYCDIDSTIVDFCPQALRIIVELALERKDDRLLRAAWNCTGWSEFKGPLDMCGDKVWQEVIDKAHSDHEIESRPLIDKDCVSVLNKIASIYTLIFISNRRPDSYKATRRWLENQGFENWAGLICTTRNKNNHMKNGRYLIDDRPKTMVEFLYDHRKTDQKERKVFSLITDYNRNLTDIPNIFLAPDWSGLDHYFKTEGIYE